MLKHGMWVEAPDGSWGHRQDHFNGRGPTFDLMIYKRHIGLARLVRGKWGITTMAPLPEYDASARTLKDAFKKAYAFLLQH